MGDPAGGWEKGASRDLERAAFWRQWVGALSMSASDLQGPEQGGPSGPPTPQLSRDSLDPCPVVCFWISPDLFPHPLVSIPNTARRVFI